MMWREMESCNDPDGIGLSMSCDGLYHFDWTSSATEFLVLHLHRLSETEIYVLSFVAGTHTLL